MLLAGLGLMSLMTYRRKQKEVAWFLLLFVVIKTQLRLGFLFCVFLRFLDFRDCVHTMYAWLSSNGISIKRLQTGRNTGYLLKKRSPYFMMISPCSFLMRILFQKIGFWCLEWVTKPEYWSFATAKGIQETASGLYRHEKQRNRNVNFIVVKCYESWIWFVKNEIP